MANDSSGPEPQAAPGAAASGGHYAPDELKGGKATTSSGGEVNLDLVLDVPVELALKVGSTELPIRDLVKLVEGSVVALDRQADQPLDVLVNGKLIAHGEIVVVDDRFGVRLTDVVSPLERIEKID